MCILIMIFHITFILKITGDPCDLNGCHWCNLFKNGTFFVLSRIFFPAKKEDNQLLV